MILTSLDKLNLPPNVKDVYLEDFAECYFPVKNTTSLPLLDEVSSERMWQPDRIAAAIVEEGSWDPKTRKMRKSVFPDLWKQTPETSTVPRVFVHSLLQLTPWKYSRIEVFDAEMMYGDIHAGLSERPAWEDSFYEAAYRRMYDWLDALPISDGTSVFVSKRPQATFLLPWSFFKRHWDAFYPERFSVVNIFPEEGCDWFLLLHAERICVFECTYDEQGTAQNIAEARDSLNKKVRNAWEGNLRFREKVLAHVPPEKRNVRP